MKSALYLLLAFGLFATVASAQTSASTQASASQDANASISKSGARASGNASESIEASSAAGKNSAGLSNGTTMQAELSHTLDAKKCKQGDAVYAKSTQDVKSDGHVVIPKGSTLVGHVTQAQARDKGQSESSLGIVFDHAVLKNGNEVPFHAVIQTLAASSSHASLANGDGDFFSSGGAMGGGTLATGGGSRPSGSGGGLIGGVASNASGAVGGMTNTATGAGDTFGSTVGSTVNTATSTATRGAGSTPSASGALSSTSSGVIGLNGIALRSVTSNSSQGSLIVSRSRNVHLDSGTRILLRTEAQNQ
jgi:hypothetical protein